MKVYLGQAASPHSGGMYRVFQGLFMHLPAAGVELVDNMAEADVINSHITAFDQIPPDKPLVVSSHGMLWASDSWGDYASKVNKELVESYLQADVVTAPSDFVARTIARHTGITPKVCRHGIDIDSWSPGEDLGYVLWNKARIDHANDSTPMQALASRAKNTQFISTYGEVAHNVEIIGRVNPDKMIDYVRHAGVYMSTTKESGGPCFGVLEAMACAVPILGWNYGGTAETIVHKETGYLARPNDYDDLYEGLRYCLSHRDRLGHNARQCVRDQYTWDAVIGSYVQAYQQALQEYPVTVSVVLTSHNLERFLPAAIESVQAQTYTDWELIIVEDASQDGSPALVDSYAAQDNRIRVLHNTQNLHVADARNRGVLHARGRYIVPLDGDDRLEPSALDRMVARLSKDRSIQIVSGKLGLFEETDLTRGRLGEWPNDADVRKQVSGYNRLPYCAMYHRKVWDHVGGYRRRIRTGVEDADFWTRALSYGYKAEILGGDPILYYTLREAGSLRTKNPYGSAAWLSWFAWDRRLHNAPAGSGLSEYKIFPEDQPGVSVIIPVGPGHEIHIQACIDSLIAQSYTNWEAILVNDTGIPWDHSPFLLGMGFVRMIEPDRPGGVAYARNQGIQAARADLLVFLDVDDVLQPNALAVFMASHEQVGGWVYSDWYAKNGELKKTHAEDWDTELLTRRSLCPITGLYQKDHALAVGGFDEDAPGWEDWDFHLRLLENGVCGTRIALPLLTYHMHLGHRREDNFKLQDTLLQYIIDHHPTLYEEKHPMGCSKCGGKQTIHPARMPTQTKGSDMTENIVMMQYVGPQSQTRTIKSHTVKGATYHVNNRKPFPVFKSDVPFFTAHKDFILAEVQQPPAPMEESPVVLHSDTPPVEKQRLVADLDLPTEIVQALLPRFLYVAQLQQAGDADILAIKGIGPARLKEIRAAL